MTVIDDDSQYTIGVVSGPSDPPKPGTVELETADLLQLAQRGTIDVERRSEPKLATGPNIVVDLGPAGPSPVKTPRRATPPRGNALVIVVYVLATAALALSIYTRWF